MKEFQEFETCEQTDLADLLTVQSIFWEQSAKNARDNLTCVAQTARCRRNSWSSRGAFGAENVVDMSSSGGVQIMSSAENVQYDLFTNLGRIPASISKIEQKSQIWRALLRAKKKHLRQPCYPSLDREYVSNRTNVRDVPFLPGRRNGVDSSSSVRIAGLCRTAVGQHSHVQSWRSVDNSG